MEVGVGGFGYTVANDDDLALVAEPVRQSGGRKWMGFSASLSPLLLL
jgi:hypothetical protein